MTCAFSHHNMNFNQKPFFMHEWSNFHANQYHHCNHYGWQNATMEASKVHSRRAQENWELLTMHLKIAVFQFIQPALIFQSVNGEFNAESATVDDKPRTKTNNFFWRISTRSNQPSELLPFETLHYISSAIVRQNSKIWNWVLKLKTCQFVKNHTFQLAVMQPIPF